MALAAAVSLQATGRGPKGMHAPKTPRAVSFFATAAEARDFIAECLSFDIRTVRGTRYPQSVA